MSKQPTIGAYVGAVLDRSGKSWKEAGGLLAIPAYISIIALPFLVSGILEQLLGEFVQITLAILATGWLFILVLFISPYHLWRDARRSISNLEDKLEAKMECFFDPNQGCVVKTVEKQQATKDQARYEREAIYVRCKVGNTRILRLKGCRASLTAIEKSVNGEEFSELPFYDPLYLAWSVQSGDQVFRLDIDHKVPRYFDVISVDSERNRIIPCVSEYPLTMRGMLSDPAVYRFTIAVTADESATITSQIYLRWTGEWDKIKAWSDGV